MSFVIEKESLGSISYHKLLEIIKSDRYKVGDRLDSEKSLAEKMHISRAVLREALLKLEMDGYIARKHGVGTFIVAKHPPVSAGLESLGSMTALLKNQGYTPGTLAMSSPRTCEDKKIKEYLGGVEELIEYSRIRTANGMPFAYDYFYMDRIFTSDKIQQIVHESLFDYFGTELKIRVMSSECMIYALNADKLTADALNVPEGFALQVLEQLFFNDKNEPIFYGKSFVNTNVVKFKLVRKK